MQINYKTLTIKCLKNKLILYFSFIIFWSQEMGLKKNNALLFLEDKTKDYAERVALGIKT